MEAVKNHFQFFDNPWFSKNHQCARSRYSKTTENLKTYPERNISSFPNQFLLSFSLLINCLTEKVTVKNFHDLESELLILLMFPFKALITAVQCSSNVFSELSGRCVKLTTIPPSWANVT